jgi:hypothetical protein
LREQEIRDRLGIADSEMRIEVRRIMDKLGPWSRSIVASSTSTEPASRIVRKDYWFLV